MATLAHMAAASCAGCRRRASTDRGEGLRLTQFLVEPACTPSRAALMTGQYSIRNGLSLIAIAGSPNTLSAHAFTMGEMFKSVGYATAIFGKWHLGSEPQSLPTAHGFDEFYGIPPDIILGCSNLSGHDHADALDRGAGRGVARKGPHIVEATAGGALQQVKPFTPEVRADIDNELDRQVDRLHEATECGSASPSSSTCRSRWGMFRTSRPKSFKGKSRIGNYGDKLMEGDYHVGQILDALKNMGIGR